MTSSLTEWQIRVAVDSQEVSYRDTLLLAHDAGIDSMKLVLNAVQLVFAILYCIKCETPVSHGIRGFRGIWYL